MSLFDMLVFPLSYNILFCMIDCCLLQTFCFIVKDRNEVDLEERGGGEELERVEVGKIIRIYV